MSFYKSIKYQSKSSLYKEKGSKFIGYVRSCETEDEAKEIIEEWRNEHLQAVHVCYAYQLGVNQISYRYSDDGEPSNSAGAPIYGQIQSFGITNVVVGVVRYYGGVNLGVGGLINAYRTAAKRVIEEAKIIQKELEKSYRFYFDYTEMAFILDEIKKLNISIYKQHFKQDCYIEVIIKESELHVLDKLNTKFHSLKTKEL